MRSGSTLDRGVAGSSLTCVTALSKHTVHIGVAPHPLKNHKHIEFLSNTGPDIKKHKATEFFITETDPRSRH